MSDGFALCASCTRHVRRNEEKCPFCGAEISLTPAGRPRPSGRRSRAEWLAYGGSAVVLCGCTGGDKLVASDASPVVDATVEAADNADVASDALTRDAATGDVASPDAPADAAVDREDVPDEGTFPCRPTMVSADAAACSRAAEWCYTNHGFLPTLCVPLTNTCEPFGTPDACASAFVWDAGCDGGRLSCACVTPTCTEGYCTDDDAGGITVGCGSCYGAPPARLERLARPTADSGDRA